MEMKIKQAYGNHQQVSEAMLVELEKLRVMCSKYGLGLAVYIEEYSLDSPIVLTIYKGFSPLSYSRLCNETAFLECVSGQLTYIDFKHNYKHN